MSDELTYKEVEELAKSADIYGVLPGASYIFVFNQYEISSSQTLRFINMVRKLLGDSEFCVLRLEDKNALRILKVK